MYVCACMFDEEMNTEELINTQENEERKGKTQIEKSRTSSAGKGCPLCLTFYGLVAHTHTHTHTHTHRGLVGVVSAAWLLSPLCPGGGFPD